MGDGFGNGFDKLTTDAGEGWQIALALQAVVFLLSGFVLATIIRLVAREIRTAASAHALKKRNANRPPPPWPWVRAALEIVAENSSQVDAKLPVELSPWLCVTAGYLSDAKNALNTPRLKTLGITHVLSVMGAPRLQRTQMSAALEAVGIKHLWVSAEDEQAYPIVDQCLPQCFDFINDARGASASNSINVAADAEGDSGGGGKSAGNSEGEEDGGQAIAAALAANNKVVVHCVAGINRSGLVATAAYMLSTRATVLEAIAHVHSKRGALLWNKSFVVQLCVLAQEHHLLGAQPEGHLNVPLPQPSAPPKQAVRNLF